MNRAPAGNPYQNLLGNMGGNGNNAGAGGNPDTMESEFRGLIRS